MKDFHQACGAPGCNPADDSQNRQRIVVSTTSPEGSPVVFDRDYARIVEGGFSLSATTISRIRQGTIVFERQFLELHYTHDRRGSQQLITTHNLLMKMSRTGECELFINLSARGIRGCTACELAVVGAIGVAVPKFYKNHKLAGYLTIDEVLQVALHERYEDRDGRFFDFSAAHYIARDREAGRNDSTLVGIHCSKHGWTKTQRKILSETSQRLFACSNFEYALNPIYALDELLAAQVKAQAQHPESTPVSAKSESIKDFIRWLSCPPWVSPGGKSTTTVPYVWLPTNIPAARRILNSCTDKFGDFIYLAMPGTCRKSIDIQRSINGPVLNAFKLSEFKHFDNYAEYGWLSAEALGMVSAGIDLYLNTEYEANGPTSDLHFD